jgi:hypothetical protein
VTQMPTPMEQPTANAIEVQHLTKKFGELVAVNDISFTVKQREIFGLLGRGENHSDPYDDDTHSADVRNGDCRGTRRAH